MRMLWSRQPKCSKYARGFKTRPLIQFNTTLETLVNSPMHKMTRNERQTSVVSVESGRTELKNVRGNLRTSARVFVTRHWFWSTKNSPCDFFPQNVIRVCAMFENRPSCTFPTQQIYRVFEKRIQNKRGSLAWCLWRQIQTKPSKTSCRICILINHENICVFHEIFS